MKTMTKIVMMLCIVAFASHEAFAAAEAKPNNVPSVAPAKAGAAKVKAKKKKVVSKKKTVKKVAEAAQAAPATVPPATSTDNAVPSSLDITMADGKKYTAALAATGTSSADLTKSAEAVTGYLRWNGRTQKSEWVTRTAQAKSSSSVDIHINLFGIFMPKKLSGTARADHLSVSGVMNNNTSLKTENSVNGINTVMDNNAANFAGAVRLKLGPAALDWQPMEVKRTLSTYVKGAPIGQVDVLTSNKIMLEFYAFEKFLKEYDSAVTIGVGCEYSRINGNLMIGLGKVANEGGDVWSSVYRATYWYYYNDRVSFFIGLEKEDVHATEKFMSAGVDKTGLEGGPFAGLNIGLF